VDFYCNPSKLAIEVDGNVHEHQPDYDRERDRVLSQHGIRVLRFTNDQVLNNVKLVLSSIEAAINAREAS
jgi:very-short-patch-repair endonuclease